MWQRISFRKIAILVIFLLTFGGSMPANAETLHLPNDAYQKLGQLRALPKFVPDNESMYTGIHTEENRRNAEEYINMLIEKIINGLHTTPTKEFVISTFSDTLPLFDNLDSDDRDRVCEYLEEIMDIIGVVSSDGLLNKWRYGFDPTTTK